MREEARERGCPLVLREETRERPESLPLPILSGSVSRGPAWESRRLSPEPKRGSQVADPKQSLQQSCLFRGQLQVPRGGDPRQATPLAVHTNTTRMRVNPSNHAQATPKPKGRDSRFKTTRRRRGIRVFNDVGPMGRYFHRVQYFFFFFSLTGDRHRRA